MFDFLNSYLGWGFVLLRLAVAIIFIVHGWPKVKNPKRIASIYHAPVYVGLIHGGIEFLGGIIFGLGLFVRPIALLFALIMVGAIYFKIFRWKVNFKSKDSTGWEFDFLVLAASLFFLLG